MENKKLGKIIKWIEEKGYGFIKEFETGNTYFCHISQIHDDRKNSEKVVAVDVYVCEVPER